jgi:hypothetical protein
MKKLSFTPTEDNTTENEKTKLVRTYVAIAVETVVVVAMAVYTVSIITDACSGDIINSDKLGLGGFIGFLAAGLACYDGLTIANTIKYRRQLRNNER